MEDWETGRLGGRWTWAVKEKGLVAHWNFDEGKGDILHDRSGNTPRCNGQRYRRPEFSNGDQGVR